MGNFHFAFILLSFIISSKIFFSSSLEITKPSQCKDDSNSSEPCPSETLVVQTDPAHGIIISVMPFNVQQTEEGMIDVPMPYEVDDTFQEVLSPDEELFILNNSIPLNEDNETLSNVTTENVSELIVDNNLPGNKSAKLEKDCTKNCPDSCERTYKGGNLTVFTSSCGMNYSNAIEFCTHNGGEILIPRHEGDNELIFDFGADFLSKDPEYEFFWYPLKRPTYGEEAVWADGKKFDTYETPFYGDSNSNQFRCFVFKHDGISLSTYDQFCRVTNARPVCELLD